MEVNIDSNVNIDFLLDSLEKINAERAKGSKKYQYLLLEGSSRSGKTWAILMFLITVCLQPSMINKSSVCVRAYRNDSTTCKGTIIADFLEIMTNVFQIFSFGKWNKTDKEYTFANGSQLIFGGANDPQKLQGKKADITWLNECMEITDFARSQLEFRNTNFFICDWNPSKTAHWIFDKVMSDKGAHLFQHSTYKDNIENLTGEQVYNIEKYEPTHENIAKGTADSWLWQVYGLGKRGIRDNVVFPRIHWDIIEDDEFPDISICQRHGYGLDFGFSLDPSACIECALARDNLYLREVFYKKGLLIGKNSEDSRIPSIQGELDNAGISKLTQIICDSADPQNIAYLQAVGYNAQACIKGKDSVNNGIALLKSRRIYIVRSSRNIQNEFENYEYIKKIDGTVTDVPADENNHAIDAVRYWGRANLTASMIADVNVSVNIVRKNERNKRANRQMWDY